MRLLLRLAMVLLSPLLLFPAFKPWYNYYNFFYGTKAISMGNAFTAIADDGTAAFWNPAGVGCFGDSKFYLSYRTDLLKMKEYESRTQEQMVENYLFQFRSKLNQIDFFSISFPVKGRVWSGGGALSYYRYIPTGFKGYAETVYYTFNPWKTQTLHRLDFQGSEGVDVLALTASVRFRQVISLGVTLQNFFNTSNIQYVQSAGGVSIAQSESKLLGGRNWIFGLLFTPVRFFTIGVSYQIPLNSKMHSTSESSNEEETEESSEPSIQDLQVQLPSRVALGVKAEPFSFLTLAYDYSKINWEKGTIQGFETFNRNLFFSFKGDDIFEKKSPENHRLGVQVSLPQRKNRLFFRGGWFSEKEFYSDAQLSAVRVTGYSLGAGIRFGTDLCLDLAYQHPTAQWKESSFFYADKFLQSHYNGNIFSISLTYNFIKLFSRP